MRPHLLPHLFLSIFPSFFFFTSLSHLFLCTRSLLSALLFKRKLLTPFFHLASYNKRCFLVGERKTKPPAIFCVILQDFQLMTPQIVCACPLFIFTHPPPPPSFFSPILKGERWGGSRGNSRRIAAGTQL